MPAYSKKYIPSDLLWDRWRQAWEENQQYQRSYARGINHQPLPVKAIEMFEELKVLKQNQ